MTTQLISLAEYRKNISKLWKKAQQENIRYIILSHSKPVLEVRPITEDFDIDLAYKKAMDDYKKWEYLEIDPENMPSKKDFLKMLEN